MATRTLFFFALFAIAAMAHGARAEEAEERAAESADAFDVDLFGPHAPALIVLGVSPSNADDAGVFADVGYDFANLGDAGKLGIGAAISVSPYWLGARDITLSAYRDERTRLQRVIARTQVSLGAARAGTEHREAIALGMGVQAQLLDAQDPKFDLESYECIHGAFERLRRPAHQAAADYIAREVERAAREGREPDLERLQEEALAGSSSEAYESERKRCRDEAAARLLAQPSWKIGLGLGLRADEPGLGHFDYDGVSAWTAYRRPLDRRGRYALFGFVRGDLDKVFDMENDVQGKADSFTAGLGAAYQRPWLRLDGSVAFTERRFDEAALGEDDFLRYDGVVDLRVREGLWLEAGGGGFAGSRYLEGAFYSFSVKLNVSEALSWL